MHDYDFVNLTQPTTYTTIQYDIYRLDSINILPDRDYRAGRMAGKTSTIYR